jgi:hypothetical protein
MKTAAWSTPLDPSYCRIGISRGVPRQQPAGFKKYRKLAPGPWFNSVTPEEYDRLYRAEVLDRLHPASWRTSWLPSRVAASRCWYASSDRAEASGVTGHSGDVAGCRPRLRSGMRINPRISTLCCPNWRRGFCEAQNAAVAALPVCSPATLLGLRHTQSHGGCVGLAVGSPLR